MRKPLDEIAEIEQYLQGKLPPADRLVFEAKVILTPSINRNIQQQRTIYKLVRWFGRNSKRRQLEALHEQLMQDPAFRQRITSIFK